MGILDIFKTKPPEVPEVKEPQILKGELGVFDSEMYSGSPVQRYTPDILRLRKGWGIYDKMMTDDQVKPVLRFKQFAVISRNWYFDCDVDDEKTRESYEEMAGFFKYTIKTMKGSFSDKLIAILSALKDGFSIVEKVYAPIMWDDKAMWGIHDMKLRPARSFEGGILSDEHGNILKLEQLQSASGIKIPLDKVVYFVHQPDIDVHYGESDLRAAYRSWWSKDIVIRFQNIHLERHASGFIWASVPPGKLSTTQKTALQNLLKNVSAMMGAHVPEGVKLEAIQPMRTNSYESAIAQHDKAIAKSLLVPNLLGLSEQGNTGSYSQSQTQFDAFLWTLDAIANQLSEALNEQLFRQLALWNFDTEDFPPFTFEPISDDQKMALAKAWTELVKGGSVTKSDNDEAWIRQLMGAPEKTEEEEIEEEPEEIITPEEGLEPPPEPPENDDWIAGQEPERQEHIKKEFAERPWLRRVNFARIEKTLDDQDALFVDQLNDLMASARVSIEKQIANIAGQRSFGNVKPKEIEGVAIPKGIVSNLRKTIRSNLQMILDDGYEIAKAELPAKLNAKAIRPGMDKTQAERFLASKAMKIAGVIEQDCLKGVQQVLENAIKYDKTLKGAIDSISEDTTLLNLLPEVDAGGRAVNVPARLENIARTNTSDAINQARTALFGQPEFRGFILSYEYSAILDDRVSEVCESLNGRIQKDWGAFTPPNHYQCRSLLIPVTAIDDWDGKTDTIPASVKPQKGFM